MINLKKEGHFEPKEEQKHLCESDIIIRRDFCGKKLTPEEFQEFQEIVNQRRPYCRKDFIPQTFIPDLRNVRY